MVKMRVPNSLGDLTTAAERYFGHAGRLRLYRYGKELITRDSQLQNLQDQEHLIVTWDGRPMQPREFHKMCSESMSHFTKKELLSSPPKQVERALRPPGEAPYQPHKLTDTSSHRRDYVRHPPQAPPSRSPPQPREVNNQDWPTGRSAYQEHYPWKTGEPQGRRRDGYPGGDEVEPWRPSKFEGGKSTYKDQYPWHPPQPRPGRLPEDGDRDLGPPRDRDLGPPPETSAGRPSNGGRSPDGPRTTIPFEGSSTYHDHYPWKDPALQQRRREPPSRGLGEPDDYKPHRVDDLSEYKRSYVPSDVKPIMIILEPEVGKWGSE